MPPDPVRSFEGLDFDAASRRVLTLLRDRLGFGLWMVTRTSGEDWIVLASLDDAYGVTDGAMLAWSDTFCSRMVRSEGPRVAPRSVEVPAYAEAPIADQLPIGAYIGVPLLTRSGDLFGTLCAIDPAPQPDEIRDELPLVELLSDLLSAILGLELDREEAQRQAERAEARALSDGLTGVLNRTGWNQVLDRETGRSRRYGHRATVVVADLDDLKAANDHAGHARGDELLVQLADAMRSISRGTDAVARLGGDEFALLAVETATGAAGELTARLKDELRGRGVSASVGAVESEPGGDLEDTWKRADLAMYDDKRLRRGD